MNIPLLRVPASRLRSLVLAVTGLLILAACGGAGPGFAEVGVAAGGPVVPLVGGVEVDNWSPEFVDSFFLAPAATDFWSENLFFGSLPPNALVYVGDFEEGVYDAEADLEFGDLVQWFDVLVPGGDVTTFEVY